MFTGLILYALTHQNRMSSAVTSPVPHPVPEGQVAVWGSGDNWPMRYGFLGYRTDFNNDGVLNSQDVFDFLAAYYAEASQEVNP